jgi:hypothetical protein
VLDIQQTLMQFIAETFIRKTRFDPLHDASTEQRLVDRLPAWLGELREQEQITLSMAVRRSPAGDRDRARAADRCSRAALRRAAAARAGCACAGMQIELRLSPRIAAFPDCSERSARCAIARSVCCPRELLRSARCNTKAQSADRIRSRWSITCRLHAPLAARPPRRSRTATPCAAAPDTPAFPGPCMAHLGATARDRLVGRRRDRAR